MADREAPTTEAGTFLRNGLEALGFSEADANEAIVAIEDEKDREYEKKERVCPTAGRRSGAGKNRAPQMSNDSRAPDPPWAGIQAVIPTAAVLAKAAEGAPNLHAAVPAVSEALDAYRAAIGDGREPQP